MPTSQTAGKSETNGDRRSNSVIDFRSDTVTRPSAAMRKVMAEAEVGDDVYGDDPTVNELEGRAAALLGKEAGLFVSSGSQSNLIALLTHCGRGEEYISGSIYHVAHDEAGGAAVLGGISPLHLPVDANGGLNAKQVEDAIKPDDIHYARTKLVCLENTVDGRVQDQNEINTIADMAHGRGLLVHLDGARLMNAAIASGNDASELAKCADTVSMCLSKGLGVPVGSVLCGPADFIHRARYNRKLLGGGMRQVGILAACGLYALKHNVTRLRDDHKRAARLASGLGKIDGLEVKLNATNMVFIRIAGEDKSGFQKYLAENNIIISTHSPDIRLVVHLDIDDAGIDRMVEVVSGYFN